MKYKYGKWIKLHNPTTSCEHKKNRYNKEWWVGITMFMYNGVLFADHSDTNTNQCKELNQKYTVLILEK